MKYLPIIMFADSVRAIQDGRKTQTRRVVKFPVWVSEDDKLKLFIQKPPTGLALYENGRPVKRMMCPYGQVGDRLWVKETWYSAFPNKEDVIYKADKAHKALANPSCWQSPIFMPRWASRLTLEITDIRVERLQDMSDEDMIAEGLYDRYDYSKAQRVWNKLNAKRGFDWTSNPWVWVISFKDVK